jgi:hypothetical protein
MCFYRRSLRIHVCCHGQSAWHAPPAHCSIKQRLEWVTSWSAVGLPLLYLSRVNVGDHSGVLKQVLETAKAWWLRPLQRAWLVDLLPWERFLGLRLRGRGHLDHVQIIWSALSSCPSPRSMNRCPIEVGIFYGLLYIVFYCQGETQARGFDAT